MLKNKATKSCKNVVSLGGNVDWICLVGNGVVGNCIGGNFVLVKMLWWWSLLLAMLQSEPVWLVVFLSGSHSVRVVMLP